MEKSEFKVMFEEHLKRVKNKLVKSSNILINKALVHDQDKIFSPTINEVYEKHFKKLKQIPFGTKEYFEYEQKYFKEAHKSHAQQRHHFYSKYNQETDIDLFDMIEAIIDISESAKQYGSRISPIESLKNKGVCNYDLEELIMNTVERLEQSD